MNTRKWILAAVVLALVLGAAGFLARARANQRLGPPGVRTSAIEGSQNLRVELPPRVLDYTSELIPQAEIVTNTLPRDTSFGQRYYTAKDGLQLALNVVLMGSDRTSIHSPLFCLVGAGWKIEKQERDEIPISRPHPYKLPVNKFTVSRTDLIEGQRRATSGVYVYWFVAHEAISAGDRQRMWWMAKHLLATGELQRWAYITCFIPCAPGQEDLVYGRMKAFLDAAVPEFQLPAGLPAAAPGATAAARP